MVFPGLLLLPIIAIIVMVNIDFMRWKGIIIVIRYFSTLDGVRVLLYLDYHYCVVLVVFLLPIIAQLVLVFPLASFFSLLLIFI
ncbi:hypothetical protein KSS87_022886 [Heliosperma pusillum]|nr:hypothetical protein KSS87_017262 [Heliosperma pusillum]KAH9616010.1 hypothetical protein KSS87_014739 [Heliosperma pusillum]KAH9620311.1 hypothetical protein KSS87_022886 [Heliosperma pusillum]